MDNEIDRMRREREIERLGREEPPSLLISIPLGLIGAAIGGAIGHYVFYWIAKQGLHATLIPGALLGLGCGVLTRRRILSMGIFCGLAGLALGAFSQWRVLWFSEDDSFRYFVTHLHRIPVHLGLIILGGMSAFWLGEGREGGVWRRRHRA